MRKIASKKWITSRPLRVALSVVLILIAASAYFGSDLEFGLTLGGILAIVNEWMSHEGMD